MCLTSRKNQTEKTRADSARGGSDFQLNSSAESVQKEKKCLQTEKFAHAVISFVHLLVLLSRIILRDNKRVWPSILNLLFD
ncbi:hypothetical protein OPV22_031034 [Ensete ventricosum]|uniref:Uncharacterized protein n=1 Tax=Ensete ventricosum TaxID=4639 RepID=A0AAV8PNB4_ENSVE|nr:hypothetical protein OPV22_031034 [Ensete ventricosum]